MTTAVTARGPALDRLRPSRLGVAVLALVAYVPVLASSPGKMPADTKLYLYLDPGRLIGDAGRTWDNRQFLGWVPHQIIAYLWPSGPWYWAMDRLGVPDWVAQRLWLGTLLFLGALGVRWAARLLGLTRAGALAAAFVYMLSPYILPYVSRTSVMLLPWAAVGWVTGLTIRAATRSRWRDAALVALVVLTAGAVNATALAMIVPAPVLWLVHAAWARTITWRRAAATALRIGGLSLVVSLWWIVMLQIQGRYGADVLAYSETLDAVSLTSTSVETLRGLGYWLFYVRDPYAFTTTASVDYMASGRTIIAGFVLLVACLLGLAVVRWTQRRYAVLLVAAGIVLAVGLHPIGDPAPLVKPLSGLGLSLALRSSTRAIPLSMFGLALGAGALVSAAATLRWRWRVLVPVAIAALAVVNLPSLWHRSFVDPALTRAEDAPAAWHDAAAALDAGDLGARVLQFVGQEFGAFRWGYTVDPPLPGLTKKPLGTRDLLPLGSAGAMDLLFALDDRFQTSTIEPAAIAPVARLLGADTIWLTNDAAFERFRTARPEPVADLFAAGVPGVGAVTSFGEAVANTPSLPMVDEAALSLADIGEALPPVQLATVDDAPGMVRAADRTVVLSGSGDGIVDAAAAGLLTGDEAVLYAADLRGGDDLSSVAQVVVTDTNRDRAHQWRGSQDVTGFTEAGGPDGGLLVTDDADQRLPVFPDETVADQTTAHLETDLVVRATGYGEPFAYRPEQRPAMAVDGDPSTAWVVGDRADPVGERLEVSNIDGELTLLQPQDTVANRMITAVRIAALDGLSAPVDVALDDSSLTTPGQHVGDLPHGAVSITITAVGPRPGGTDTGPSAVGFAELGLGTNREVVDVPTGVLDQVGAQVPASIVLTRERTDPLDRWRSDPEPSMVRRLALPRALSSAASVTLRLDRRASDEVLAALTGRNGALSDARLTGNPDAVGANAVDGNPATAWTSPFVDPVGSTLTVALDPSVTAGALTIHQAVDDVHSLITSVRVTVGGQTVDLDVPPPDASGASTVELPAVAASSMAVEITGITPSTTVDRRFGETTTLPVAITELDSPAITGDTAGDPAGGSVGDSAGNPIGGSTGDTAGDPAGGSTGGSGNTVSSSAAAPGQPACRDDLLTVDGRPVSLAVGPSQITALVAGEAVTVGTCDGSPVALDAGTHVVDSTAGLSTGIDVDRVVLTSGTLPATAQRPRVTVSRTDFTRTATVSACPNGCWLTLGEGLNDGWAASAGGRSLGAPRQLDGGFNGWWLPPSTTPTTVTMTWQPQTKLNVALGLSALAIVGCLLLVVLDRRRRRDAVDVPAAALVWERDLLAPVSLRSALVAAIVALVAATLLISWTFALAGLVVGAVVLVTRRPLAGALAAAVLAALLGIVMWWRNRSEQFFVNAGWPGQFEDLHRWGLLVIVLLLVSVAVTDGRPPPRPDDLSGAVDGDV